MMRKIAIVTASVGALVLGVGLTPAVAAQPDDPGQSARAAESKLVNFHAANPEPKQPAASASQEAWNAYWQRMADWWNEVPWDAVAEQWGCEAGGTQVELVEGKDGSVTAQYSGMVQCDSDLGQPASGYVGIPQPRSQQLAAYSAASKTDIGILAVQQCDLPGGDNYCLTRPSSGSSTLTASFQKGSPGTITGRARLGSVAATGSCTNGTQIALGGLGTGGQYANWYATGTAAYNGRFSSAFMVGTSTYGRHCANM